MQVEVLQEIDNLKHEVLLGRQKIQEEIQKLQQVRSKTLQDLNVSLT